MTRFGIAVGVASLIGYRLMARLPKRRAAHRSSAARPGGGVDAGDSGDHFVWSADENAVSGRSGAASGSGGSDVGGGSDQPAVTTCIPD